MILNLAGKKRSQNENERKIYIHLSRKCDNVIKKIAFSTKGGEGYIKPLIKLSNQYSTNPGCFSLL